ncbi:hypothetical protein WDU94_014701 [Cyamophila willieti]
MMGQSAKPRIENKIATDFYFPYPIVISFQERIHLQETKGTQQNLSNNVFACGCYYSEHWHQLLVILFLNGPPQGSQL